MLNELKFVQGAVARKDFQPALTHFHIQGGRIQGYNGTLALSCPIALDLDVTPNAAQLVKAVQHCTTTIALSMTGAGRLAIKSGKFKAYVDALPGGFPEIRPSGTHVEATTPLLPALRTVAPCIAEDASRQWARGVLFRGRSLFATNNIVLVEHYLGTDFPFEMNLPAESVNELLRIGEEPTHFLVEENAVTFCFTGERWMRSQLYSAQWPDVSRVLDSAGDPKPLPFGEESLTPLLPFLDEGGRVFFLDGVLATSREDGVGARVEVPGLTEGGVFNAHMLRLVLALADAADFTAYPAPCPFQGGKLRGALMGMRS